MGGLADDWNLSQANMKDRVRKEFSECSIFYFISDKDSPLKIKSARNMRDRSFAWDLFHILINIIP